jgi:BlaI family transcriptional regulator, penicillinase repressor
LHIQSFEINKDDNRKNEKQMRNKLQPDSTIKELTRAEEQVMQALWKTGRGMVHDLLRHYPEPKPAYNTVSTIIRILEQKGFVGHKAYGRTHEYYPLVSKKEYSSAHFGIFLNNYFGNSFKSLASFFAGEKKLTIHELEDIQQMISKEIEKQKKAKP